MLKPGSTLYDLLEIEPDATPKQIQDAYLRMKQTYSRTSAALYGMMDVSDTDEILQKVEDAYSILSNPGRRTEYDHRYSIEAAAPKPVLAPTPLKTVPRAVKSAPTPTETTGEVDLGDWSGTTLKATRESLGISIEEMSQFTKINRNYLKAIEEEDYPRLPAPVFLRGFLVQIAKRLRLPEEKVISNYLSRARQHSDATKN